jgi:hypothetical protein
MDSKSERTRNCRTFDAGRRPGTSGSTDSGASANTSDVYSIRSPASWSARAWGSIPCTHTPVLTSTR